MAQAKTLTQAEIDQVLRYASTRKYPERNRALILSSFYLGLRVAEIALLKLGDVVNEDGTIKNEIRLAGSQTKGGHPRTVFIPDKLKPEYAAYLKTRHIKDPTLPLFHTENKLRFSPNGLCVWFFSIYNGKPFIAQAGFVSHTLAVRTEYRTKVDPIVKTIFCPQ